MNGESTYREITTQPAAWDDALAGFAATEVSLGSAWRRLSPRNVIFTGCGSTHYLALTAASLFRRLTGIPATAQPASELIFFDDTLTDPTTTLLVAVSRSGTTTETLQAVERFRQRGGRAVWTITCYPDSPLARDAALVLPATAAQEESVAQTRSFSTMLLLAQALAARLGGADWTALRSLPDDARGLLARDERLVANIGGNLADNRVYFLGSGSHYGIASEAMLKLTEMSLTTSQAFHFLEFRHGPMSMVEPGTQIIGILTPVAAHHELPVLHEMSGRGARTLALNSTPHAAGATWEIVLPAGRPAWALPALCMPALQLLAFYRARAKGLDPDNPRHLAPVIQLDPVALMS